MKLKHIQKIGLGIFFLAQLFVLGRMTWQHEMVAIQGIQMKFRIEPVDPNDPFRGRYVILDFMDDMLVSNSQSDMLMGDQPVFLSFQAGEDGYARMADIQLTAFDGGAYIELSPEAFHRRGKQGYKVDLPFDRFYMEESKAPEVERELRKNNSREEPAYALVSFKGGKAVLMDVILETKSVKDLVD